MSSSDDTNGYHFFLTDVSTARCPGKDLVAGSPAFLYISNRKMGESDLKFKIFKISDFRLRPVAVSFVRVEGFAKVETFPEGAKYISPGWRRDSVGAGY